MKLLRLLHLSIAALLALSSTGAVAAEDHPQRMGYDLDQAKMASFGSYIGFSDFCEKYGLGYAEVANRLLERLNHQPFWTRANEERQADLNQIYLLSRNYGAKGYIFVTSEDAFLNSPKPGMTMQFVCKRAYDSAVELANVL